VGSVCGDRMGRFYGDRVGRASAATAGFCLRKPRGAHDMLHGIEEHALISLLSNKNHNRHYRSL
jgi:hypothetical protein